ncbi:S-layer homology domain-containing protein [Niallia oryzisoli]|uniref:S-layer homology domain-containing protein n=1 Tax=Niallia oryzisoli TaxID=1737571 RepID=UPI00373577CD
MIQQSKTISKLLAAAVTATTLIVTPLIPLGNVEASGKKFKDVVEQEFYYEAVNVLTGNQVLNGYSDGTFKPGNKITRAEVAKIIAEAIGIDTTNVINPNFTDVSKGAWYYPSVAALSNAKIIGGYGDQSFKPDAEITRAEMAKILVEAYDSLDKLPSSKGKFTDVEENSWYAGYIAGLIHKEITNGRTPTTFDPNGLLTRGEAATFVYRTENLSSTIKAVTDTTITINGIEYEIDSKLKGILNKNNSEILENAKIKFEKADRTITKITSLDITSSGAASKSGEAEFSGNVVLDGGNSTINGDLKISSNYVTVNNLIVTGDFEIGTELQNDFYSNNLEVQGKTIVNGGDTNTVVFKSGKLNNVEINKLNVHVESKGNTSIKELNVTNNANISADATSTINKLSVKENVTALELNAEVESLYLENNKALLLKGQAEISNLYPNGDSITLDITGSIENLFVPQGKTVESVISNINQVEDKITNINGGVAEVPVTPPAGGGGGGGAAVPPSSSLTLQITGATLTMQNASGAPIPGASIVNNSLDASRFLDTDRFIDVTLEATSDVKSIQLLGYDGVKTINFTTVNGKSIAVIRPSDLGVDKQGDGVLMSTLRSYFDNSLPVTGALKNNNGTTANISLTVKLK